MTHAKVLSAFEGHAGGRIIIATLGDDPAAGEEVSVTVPGRAVWQVHSITATLVASVGAADRKPGWCLDDGTNRFYHVHTTVAHTANKTIVYSAAPGIGVVEAADAEAVTLPLPPTIMLPGWRIATHTFNLQAADNWSAPVLYVTELPERGAGVWDDMIRALSHEILERRESNV